MLDQDTITIKIFKKFLENNNIKKEKNDYINCEDYKICKTQEKKPFNKTTNKKFFILTSRSF